ncbi:hypothetical protein H6784_03995 [Candidatus Nomurabacteria bacterium]|nr:hypothetical protein [Candidatus Nomurabacteria bacterium]
MAQLVTQGAMYISCLQVHGVKRGLGYGYGAEIVLKAIKRIQQEWPIVWGVCEPRLLKWYVSLGAEVLDPGINRDHLALIVWR